MNFKDENYDVKIIKGKFKVDGMALDTFRAVNKICVGCPYWYKGCDRRDWWKECDTIFGKIIDGKVTIE